MAQITLVIGVGAAAATAIRSRAARNRRTIVANPRRVPFAQMDIKCAGEAASSELDS
jgi:hypothetical protein